jgi:hypothetical protein
MPVNVATDETPVKPLGCDSYGPASTTRIHYDISRKTQDLNQIAALADTLLPRMLFLVQITQTVAVNHVLEIPETWIFMGGRLWRTLAEQNNGLPEGFHTDWMEDCVREGFID